MSIAKPKHMISRTSLSLILLLNFFVASCGGLGGDSSSMSYSFSFNGCETGEHQFKSLEQYCTGLQDEQLNKGCAVQSRKETYSEKCPSTTAWATTNIGTQECGDKSCNGAKQYCLKSYVGALETPAVTPECRSLPKGSDFDDSDLTCDLLVDDAQLAFPTTNNCKQSTFCLKNKVGGYSLDCHASI